MGLEVYMCISTAAMVLPTDERGRAWFHKVISKEVGGGGSTKKKEGIGLAKKAMCFFHKLKDTFFIFTNKFIDKFMDILSMSAISCVV